MRKASQIRRICCILYSPLSAASSLRWKMKWAKLFDRGTRKIVLTNEGLLLRRRAEEILELVDKTEREISEQDETVEGVVSIGCGDLAAVQLLPELMRSFHERYPAVTFDLYTATADHIKDRMDRGRMSACCWSRSTWKSTTTFALTRGNNGWLSCTPIPRLQSLIESLRKT